jgi:hypothetical protein
LRSDSVTPILSSGDASRQRTSRKVRPTRVNSVTLCGPGGPAPHPAIRSARPANHRHVQSAFS